MHYAVFQFGKLCTVPALSGAYKIAGDALQPVDMVAVAVRAFLQIGVSILESAVHAAVSVVVHRTVSHVVLVHQVYDGHDGFRVVGCVSVDFHIEDMSATCKCMVRSFYLCFVFRRTMVVDRDMVGVCVIFLVGDAFQDSEFFAVHFRETACKPFSRRGKNAEVVLELLGKFVRLVPHVRYDSQTEFLCLF